MGFGYLRKILLIALVFVFIASFSVSAAAERLIFDEEVFICFDEHGNENRDCRGNYSIEWDNEINSRIVFESYFVDDDGEVNLVNSRGSTYNVFREYDGINNPVHDPSHSVYIGKNLTSYMTNGTNMLEGYAKDLGRIVSYVGGRIKIYAYDQPANTPPRISGLPDFRYEKDSGPKHHIVDLRDYSYDAETCDNDLQFSIISQNTSAINCYIDDSYYVSCYNPEREGTSYIKVRVYDEEREYAEDTFSIRVNDISPPNTRPVIFGIPNEEIDLDSGPLYNLVDLRDYAYDLETPDSELEFEIISQNSSIIYCAVTNGYINCRAPRSEGTSTIRVRVYDEERAYDDDYFNITVSDNSNTGPEIEELPNQTINKDSGSQHEIFDLRDYAEDNETTENDLRFDVIEESNEEIIHCYIEDNYYLSCYAPEETGTSDVTIRVYDEEDAYDEDTFRITVNESPPENRAPDFYEIYYYEYIEENSDYSERLIDLWTEVYDAEDDDDELYFFVENQSDEDLIDCRIEDNRWFECYAPENNETGMNSVVVVARDTQGAEGATTVVVKVEEASYTTCGEIDLDSYRIELDESTTEYHTFTLSNDSSRDFDIESIYAYDNSSYFSLYEEYYPSYVDSYDSEDIEIKVRAYSVSSNKTSEGHLRVRGEFSNGDSCEEIFDFDVKVFDDDDNDEPGCSDIEIDIDDLHIDEDDSEEFTFYVKNNSDETFYIDSSYPKFDEDSRDFRITLTDDERTLSRGERGKFKMRINSDSVSENETEKVKVYLKGEFSGGNDCSNIYEYFDVTVRDEDDYDDPECGDVDIQVYDITVDEDETEYQKFYIKNNSDSTFHVESIYPSESSSYFSITKTSSPSQVYSGDKESFELKIKSNTVSSSKTGEVKVTLKGYFSGGPYCRSSGIKEYFDIKVRDEADDDPEPPVEGELKLRLSSPAITMKDVREKEISLRIENDSNDDFCVDLEAVPSSSYVTAELERDEVCVDEGESKTIFVKIKAEKAGDYTIKIKGSYENEEETAVIALKVEDETEGEPVVTILSYPAEIKIGEETRKEIEVVVENNSNLDLVDATIEFVNLPDGIKINYAHRKDVPANSTETIKAELENESAEAGDYGLFIKVSYTGGSLSKTSELTIEEVEESVSPPTGFLTLGSMASPITIALLFMIVVLLAVLVLVRYYNSK